MPVRDMGYQHAKYMEQIKEVKESNRKTGNYPNPMTKELNDSQKLRPVITLVLNYSQKEWEKPRCLNDMLEFPEDIGEELTKWIPEHPICIINLASQPETTICQYQSDFKYIVRYLSCGNDRKKLDEYFQTTEFELERPEAFLDWLSAVTNDRRYRKAAERVQLLLRGLFVIRYVAAAFNQFVDARKIRKILFRRGTAFFHRSGFLFQPARFRFQRIQLFRRAFKEFFHFQEFLSLVARRQLPLQSEKLLIRFLIL